MRLALHLIVGLLISFGALGLFIYLADRVEENTEWVQFDREFSARMEAHGRETPVLVPVFIFITDWVGVIFLYAIGIGMALILFRRKHRQLALVWMVTLLGGALLNMTLKDVYQRARPIFETPIVRPHGYSFPSGHSMNSLVCYGMLAYVLILLAAPRVWQRVAIIAGLLPVVLAVGFSRIYLGAHYVTDVLAGYAVAVVWLTVCISAIETLRRRSERMQASAKTT